MGASILTRVCCLLLCLFTPIISSPLSSAELAAADKYDYIIVGSGPGGGPLACNLARANYSVLLIEAGDQSVAGSGGQYPPQITWDFFVKHYADSERAMKYSHLTWRNADGSYWVGRDNPPADAKLLGVYYPRGATLGGSSMINAMVTLLPSDSDWDHIVELTGDTSWSASNMRKIFQRIEHNNYLPKGTEGHGFDGYFQTNMDKPTRVQNPVLSIMGSEATSLGLNATKLVDYLRSDPNFLDAKRDQTQGIWGLPSHTKTNGQRFSSRDYIQDTLNATNADGSKKYPLTIQMNSLATRVLFNTTGCAKPRATGVEFLQGKSLYNADPRFNANSKGVLQQVTASREVVLAGGTFNSPQLLMLSGIGNSEDLQQLKIPVLVNSPGVGRNMQDNEEMPIVGQFKGGGGGGLSGCTMLKTKHAAFDERDMFLMQGPFVFRGFWPSNQTNKNLVADPGDRYGISMVKMHPQNNAGYVKLKSANPQEQPDINFNHFGAGKETDMGAMKDTVAWARQIYNTTNSPTGPVNVMEPPCPNGPDANGSCGQADEDWITAQTFGHHPTSTCAIGGDNDTMAVVDSRFRVHGVAGLRVVDASTFPRTPGAFPVVPTFMISEKASDTILEDAKKEIGC